jgi:hypothetical protein
VLAGRLIRGGLASALALSLALAEEPLAADAAVAAGWDDYQQPCAITSTLFALEKS